MGGKAQVCVGRSEEVESDHGLGNERIQLLGGKVGVARGESGTKIIFECADLTFSGVAAVGVQGNNLEVNIALAEVFLNGVGAHVFEDVESGSFTMLLYVLLACYPGYSYIQGL